jgi:hypothetical protein
MLQLYFIFFMRIQKISRMHSHFSVKPQTSRQIAQTTKSKAIESRLAEIFEEGKRKIPLRAQKDFFLLI